MKTEDLIEVLAADASPRQSGISRVLVVAIAGGTLVSLVTFLAVLGVRPDFGTSLKTWRFDVKLALTILAFGLAFADCLRLSNPVNRAFATWLSWSIPVALLAAVAAELLLSPPISWTTRLVGTNALLCLIAIPSLALAPLAAGLYAMRSGAPSSGAVAGAAIGRLSAAVASVMYALHCFDDSPLFVATWYTLATLIVMSIGAVAGHRLLRW